MGSCQVSLKTQFSKDPFSVILPLPLNMVLLVDFRRSPVTFLPFFLPHLKLCKVSLGLAFLAYLP